MKMLGIARAVALLMMLVCIGGCAREWTKPGVSEQEFNADRLGCEQDALKAYPVVHEPKASYRPPASSKLDPNCVAQSGMNNCDGAGPSGTNPSGAQSDANAYDRDAAVRACLTSLGYKYTRAQR
jgi:hypothetical protein